VCRALAEHCWARNASSNNDNWRELDRMDGGHLRKRPASRARDECEGESRMTTFRKNHWAATKPHFSREDQRANFASLSRTRLGDVTTATTLTPTRLKLEHCRVAVGRFRWIARRLTSKGGTAAGCFTRRSCMPTTNINCDSKATPPKTKIAATVP